MSLRDAVSLSWKSTLDEDGKDMGIAGADMAA